MVCFQVPTFETVVIVFSCDSFFLFYVCGLEILRSFTEDHLIEWPGGTMLNAKL